ncbi:beclin 1-associated autophagy-related key regulator [Onthophagus taurus]|uniref:beclin 1-associated autophagy-related key regulator n=1 Tax=Onthophagus taurus TaxID=166361 RepID=UPI000C20C839|nr:beclin 1-associated autophagy-related key regulator [Onthophagus taurus]
MATSSSDESSSAPRDFHLSSSLDSGSRLSPNGERCPLCGSYRKKFFCRDCIQSGEFRSATQPIETFSEKQARLFRTQKQLDKLQSDCLPIVKRKQRVKALSDELKQKTDRVRNLRSAIAEKKELQRRNKSRLEELITSNEKLVRDLPKYEALVQKRADCVLGKFNDKNIIGMNLEEEKEQLKKMVILRIRQLIKYIFPISKNQIKPDMEISQSEIASELAEASRTTYVRNRWVYSMDYSGESHIIVAPFLPGTGNYSAYNDWVAQNKDQPGATANVPVHQNPAFRISAALTYTAQLVHVLAFYLDVFLPHKLNYSDFCTSDISDQQFLRRVARLNANVLQLCVSQHTDLNTLHPRQTLHNIIQLLDSSASHLGRTGPIEVDNQIAAELEEQLSADLLNTDDSDSEESDVVANEWEAVPHVPILETTAPSLQSTQTIPPQQVNSMAGGLMNSAAATIASIWKGFTGR